MSTTAGPPPPADEPAHLDRQARLLDHLPDHGLGIGLTRLDPAARDGPEPGAGLVPALDHQQPAPAVRHDRAHARDHGGRHADKYPVSSLTGTSGGTVPSTVTGAQPA